MDLLVGGSGREERKKREGRRKKGLVLKYSFREINGFYYFTSLFPI